MLVTILAVVALVVAVSALVYSTLAFRRSERARAQDAEAEDLVAIFDPEEGAPPEVIAARRKSARKFLEEIERPKGFTKKPARRS